MSFILKRENSPYWYYYWSDESGVKHGKSLQVKTKIEAEVRKGEEDKKRFLQGAGLPNRDLQWSRFKEEYRAFAKPPRKDIKTAYEEEQTLKKVDAVICPGSLKDFSPRVVETWMSTLAQSLAPTTVNKHYRHLKAILNKAVAWDYLDKSPFRGVKQFKLDKTHPRFLSKDEIEALYKAARDDRPDAYFMCLVFIYTGVRMSELIGMTWEVFNLDRGTVRVFGKGGKERTLEIEEKVLRPYLLKYRPLGATGFVFHTNGKPLSRFTISDIFSRLYKKADPEIKNADVHTLRHTYGSHAIMSGIDIRTLKELMGHESITTTMIYAHLARPHIEQSMKKFIIK